MTKTHHKTIMDDLDLSVSDNQVRVSKRAAVNDRQRKAAEADEEYAKFLDKVHCEIWPDWGRQ